MRSLKNAVLLGAVSLIISGCGGGGESGTAATPVAVSGPPAASQYETQTKAAKDAFNERLESAQAQSDEWMESNRREANVKTTQSGLQYKVNKPSSNPDGASYQAGQEVTVHYEGRLIDGTVFDSSFARGRPEILNPSELIQGWQEALNLMKPGDEWTLFIPPALGYGTRGKGGGIPANAVLIFDVELR